MKDVTPRIALGQRFWPLTNEEKREIAGVFRDEKMRRLATMLRCRDDDADVRVLDAAYWLKGCSSLGRLRYAVLLEVEDKKVDSAFLHAGLRPPGHTRLVPPRVSVSASR